MKTAMNAIETRHLTRKFGELTAVDDVSFEVETGEIFGFLGPNGAGKSTTMMMLTTLLRPTSGEAMVAGTDVTSDPKEVRKKIGYIQQDISVDEYMTGRENLQFHARLAHMPKKRAESRIDEMLQLVELEEKQHEYVHGYSGGMRKRLDIAGGLLHMPDVLFLDEPTVGLDIQTRRKIWEYLRRIHKEYNVTIFLTTHYMEEADSLCDRVGIIDWGKIVTIDNPSSMKSALGGEIIAVTIQEKWCADLVHGIKSKIGDRMKGIDVDKNKDNAKGTDTITMTASHGTELVPRIFEIASAMDIAIDAIKVTHPTLDDVFIHHTGHEIRDEENAGFNKRREYAANKRRSARGA